MKFIVDVRSCKLELIQAGSELSGSKFAIGLLAAVLLILLYKFSSDVTKTRSSFPSSCDAVQKRVFTCLVYAQL